MRTRSQARKRRQQQVRQTSVESPNLEKPNNNQETFNPPIVTMDDNRTMAQLLEAPTEGYEDAIVVPEITANNFEIKHGLLNLVQNKQFFGHDKEDPHAHIRYFNKITSTMKFPNVPSTSVKLMLFPFSLEGAARIWLEKEPPRSILTWDDLVSKFINKFFPPSKTTNLRNEITRFQQKFDETFYEAWDRFNDLLRGCPHHGFSELHQLDTFYNALNSNDQDSLNSAAGGNFLDKMPRECLKIIESKSKVRQSRSKAIVSKVSTSSSTPAVSSDVAELKDMVRALILDKKNQTPAPAPVKAIEQSCVNQPPAYQAPVPQTHGVSKTDFDNYVKANDAVLRNMQNQGQTLQNQMANLTDMLSKFVTSNTASTSGSGTLPGNTVTNPKEDLKGITTRSGVAYQGPTSSSSPKVMNRDTETSRALIDVYEGEITLRVGKEAITFNLDQTSRYTANYNHMTANRIDVIELACEEYSQEVLGFSDSVAYGNPSPDYDPIVSNSSPTLTPFGDNYSPGIRKELKVVEAKTVKSSIDEPPEVELKDLPPHLEYAFLEGDDKLPVIISKDLKDEENAALIKVLKSHKRAIAWRLSDIKGVDPEFCTHKILIEEDYEPTV
ncbi:reverse transcriptase domain-containing protein [Tanacetum coccineum]